MGSLFHSRVKGFRGGYYKGFVMLRLFMRGTQSCLYSGSTVDPSTGIYGCKVLFVAG